jgi:hypothetical protein
MHVASLLTHSQIKHGHFPLRPNKCRHKHIDLPTYDASRERQLAPSSQRTLKYTVMNTANYDMRTVKFRINRKPYAAETYATVRAPLGRNVRFIRLISAHTVSLSLYGYGRTPSYTELALPVTNGNKRGHPPHHVPTLNGPSNWARPSSGDAGRNRRRDGLISVKIAVEAAAISTVT